MEVKNNPAGRLHDLLKLAKAQPAKANARNVWASVFDVDPQETGMILKMLADLINLVSETKAAIARLDDVDHDIYLKPFNKIEQFLSQVNLDVTWERWQKFLDEPTLYGLQFAADKLSRINGSTNIPDKDIDSIRKELEQVVNTILESDLPQGLKALFLKNLESIRDALLVYRIRGIDGIEDELERAIGSFILNQKDIPPASDKTPNRKLWERIIVFLDRINKVVTTARGVKEIAGPTVHAISNILDK